jgi:hypothetical protein
MIATVGDDIGPVAEVRLETPDIGTKTGIQPVRRDGKQNLSFAMLQQIGVMQEATIGGLRRIAGIAMRHASLADSEQTREPSPGSAILRIAEQIRRIVAE